MTKANKPAHRPSGVNVHPVLQDEQRNQNKHPCAQSVVQVTHSPKPIGHWAIQSVKINDNEMIDIINMNESSAMFNQFLLLFQNSITVQ